MYPALRRWWLRTAKSARGEAASDHEHGKNSGDPYNQKAEIPIINATN